MCSQEKTEKQYIQTEDMEFFRPYLKQEVYEKCMENKTWAKYMATCLFSETDDIIPVPEHITQNYLIGVDWMLKQRGSSLRAYLQKEAEKISASREQYEKKLNTAEHRMRQMEYDEEWNRWQKS